MCDAKYSTSPWIDTYAVGLMKFRVAHNTTQDETDSEIIPHRLCDLCLCHGQVGAGRAPLIFPAGCEIRWKLLIFGFAMPVDDRPRYDSISKSYHVEASRSVPYTLCNTCTLITPIIHLC